MVWYKNRSTPATKTFGTLDTAFAGLFAEETAAESHQTNRPPQSVHIFP
jgi:hypothetical protein